MASEVNDDVHFFISCDMCVNSTMEHPDEPAQLSHLLDELAEFIISHDVVLRPIMDYSTGHEHKVEEFNSTRAQLKEFFKLQIELGLCPMAKMLSQEAPQGEAHVVETRKEYTMPIDGGSAGALDVPKSTDFDHDLDHELLMLENGNAM